MEIPRLGSFDKEYGRENRKRILPQSLWTETKKEHIDTKPLTGKAETEVAIIGGGITGLSAAIHLRAQGRNAMVLEAGEIGWGGSGRNGGHFNPGLKVDPEDILARHGKQRGDRIVQMADQTCDLVFDMINRYNIQCDVVRNGYIQPAVSKKDLSVVLKKARQWMKLGAPAEVLDSSKISEFLGSDYYIGGQLDLRGGSLQPLSYVRGLARAAMQQGAQVHAHSPAITINHQKNGWHIHTPQGTVHSKYLLIGTNAYAGLAYNGRGVPMATMMGKQLADLVCGEDIPLPV